MSRKEAERLTRREREFLRRRREIIDAAEEIFAEKGFASSTMDEIADRAEFAVGTLYKFFENKIDLFSAMFRLRADEMEEEIYDILEEDGEAVQLVESYFTCRIELFWKYPQFLRIFLSHTDSVISDPRIGILPELLERYDRLVQRLESIFSRGIEEGSFRPLGAGLLTRSLEGLIRSYGVYLCQFKHPERDREVEERLYDLFTRGSTPPTHPLRSC